jgi:hypothetical protein
MNVFKSLLLAASVALMATVATSASGAPNSKFAKADLNKDKALSQSEACAGKTPRICKNFAAMDVNKDGVVTRAEIRAHNNAKRAARGSPTRS